MTKTVVVVESPAKAKTIKKYLGEDFEVLASYGHVRDLIAKDGAVDVENAFAMRYEPIDRNQKHVAAIGKALRKADQLMLATDPDREGEAIAWHLAESLEEQGLLKDKTVKRVVFHEITKPAIQNAVSHPGEISDALVSAQQARRALDYLVGFNISPLLWRKIKPGLSAGRVQSPALRLIVEREKEIEAFVTREYWTIDLEAQARDESFQARLTRYSGDKVEQFSFPDEQSARAAEQQLLSDCRVGLKVTGLEKKQRRRNPPPPFITSTLQQEGSRKLRFGTQRTMRVAQQLYEGVDIDGELTGLITYMRTDSVTLAAEAITEIRQTATRLYGSKATPSSPRQFKTKSKNAQEAHEAIRPTLAARTPQSVKTFLSEDQFRLYDLIWKRAMASQMLHATYEQVGFDLVAEQHTFRATGSRLTDPGFLAVYQEGSDDDTSEETDRLLPPVSDGDVVKLLKLMVDQHFTEPPPRFSEASLVKALEEFGIGRPSTYANIISTLVNREYVELEERRFRPTDIGRIVSDFLTQHFTSYVDYDFTAELEDDLDAIARGEKQWVPVMSEFWEPFKQQVDAKKDISREEVAQARQLGSDPKSGKPVSVRMGRYGPFVQIGTKDDEEKPRFAGLRPGQKISQISLEEALELFKLPRDLGATPEGEPLSANIGRFGPYIRYGNKFVSLGDEDPLTVTPEKALQLVSEKKAADQAKILRTFDDTDIQILNGRWGPYITDGKKNAKMPKEKTPDNLSLDEAQAALAAAPEKRKRSTGGRRAKAGK